MRGVNIGASKAKFEYAILDEDFDDIEGFTGAVLSSIERCGTIDIHPNDWGRHDNLGVYTLNMPHYGLLDTQTKPPKAPRDIKQAIECTERWEARRKASALVRLSALERRELREKQLYDWAHPKLVSFPHSTAAIAHDTAVEFSQFGQDDARKRSITDDEWIWKRSRFMAGFK